MIEGGLAHVRWDDDDPDDLAFDNIIADPLAGADTSSLGFQTADEPFFALRTLHFCRAH
jgi:hypothetical protein